MDTKIKSVRYLLKQIISLKLEQYKHKKYENSNSSSQVKAN